MNGRKYKTFQQVRYPTTPIFPSTPMSFRGRWCSSLGFFPWCGWSCPISFPDSSMTSLSWPPSPSPCSKRAWRLAENHSQQLRQVRTAGFTQVIRGKSSATYTRSDCSNEGTEPDSEIFSNRRSHTSFPEAGSVFTALFSVIKQPGNKNTGQMSSDTDSPDLPCM